MNRHQFSKNPGFGQPGEMEMLLSADVFADVLRDGVRHGGRNDVIAEGLWLRVLTGAVLATTSMTLDQLQDQTPDIVLEEEGRVDNDCSQSAW